MSSQGVCEKGLSWGRSQGAGVGLHGSPMPLKIQSLICGGETSEHQYLPVSQVGTQPQTGRQDHFLGCKGVGELISQPAGKGDSEVRRGFPCWSWCTHIPAAHIQPHTVRDHPKPLTDIEQPPHPPGPHVWPPSVAILRQEKMGCRNQASPHPMT